MNIDYKWLLLIPVLLVAVGLGLLIPRLVSDGGDEQLDIVAEGNLSAQAEEQVNQMVEEIDNYERLLRAAPDDIEILKPLADDYFDLAELEEQNQLTNDAFKHYKAAVDNYRKILSLQPQNVPVRLSLALAYNGLRMRDVAYRELASLNISDLGAVDTSDTSLLIDAGLLYQEGYGLLTEAQTLLARATVLEPDNSRAWLSLGYVLKAEGRAAEANAAFEKVIEIDANSDYAQAARDYLGQ